MAVRTPVTFTDDDPTTAGADALVVGASKQDGAVAVLPGSGLGEEATGAIDEALAALGAEAGTDEITRLTGVAGVRAPLVVVVGVTSRGPAPPPSSCAGPPVPRPGPSPAGRPRSSPSASRDGPRRSPSPRGSRWAPTPTPTSTASARPAAPRPGSPGPR